MSNIRSADQISISRSNIWFVDRTNNSVWRSNSYFKNKCLICADQIVDHEIEYAICKSNYYRSNFQSPDTNMILKYWSDLQSEYLNLNFVSTESDKNNFYYQHLFFANVELRSYKTLFLILCVFQFVDIFSFVKEKLKRSSFIYLFLFLLICFRKRTLKDHFSIIILNLIILF